MVEYQDLMTVLSNFDISWHSHLEDKQHLAEGHPYIDISCKICGWSTGCTAHYLTNRSETYSVLKYHLLLPAHGVLVP